MNEPKLRFKADDGNQFPSWGEKKLGDICTPLTYGMNVAAIKYDGLNKYIRITDIDDESHLYKSDEYVSPNGVLDDRYLVGENDILFARTGASVGKSYIYNKKDGKLYYAGFLIKAHVKSENSNFVFYQTLTERYAKWVQLISMRSGQPGINANEYSEFGIQIPCLQEQRKIASLFTELDTLIQSAEKELEGYRELKQGMLQKMFPKNGERVPEIRFPEFTGDWEQRKLGDIFKEYSEKHHEELPALTIIQGGGTILREKSDRNLQYDKSNLSGYKMVKKDDFIVHLRSFEGGLEKANSDGIISPAYHTLHGENVDPRFYYPYFRSYEFINKKLVAHVYGIRDGRSIDVDGMKTIKIPYTSYEEQKKIGDYLDTIDNLIVLQQKELDGYKELKKGLLQQMFC